MGVKLTGPDGTELKLGDTTEEAIGTMNAMTEELKKADEVNIGKKVRAAVLAYEDLEKQKKALAEEQREIMERAKYEGLSVTALKEVIKRRRMDPMELADRDDQVTVYEELL